MRREAAPQAFKEASLARNQAKEARRKARKKAGKAAAKAAGTGVVLVRKVVGEPPIHFRSMPLHSATPVHIQSYSPSINPDEAGSGGYGSDLSEGTTETPIFHDMTEKSSSVDQLLEGSQTAGNAETIENPDGPENMKGPENLKDVGSSGTSEAVKSTGSTEETASFDEFEGLSGLSELKPPSKRKSRAKSRPQQQDADRLGAADFNALFEQSVVETESEGVPQKTKKQRRNGPSSVSLFSGGGGARRKLSKKIDIVGFTPHSKFLAHSLSVSGHKPAGLYVHSKYPLTQWGLENREMVVYNQGLIPVSSTPVPYPTYIFDRRRYSGGPRDLGFFDNLIVDMSAASGISFFMELKTRIDRRTTICLMHPGLGEMEMLLQKVFRDPDNRPSFVLGYSTHNIAKIPGKMFSIQHRDAYRGRILLHGVVESRGTTPADLACAEEQRIQTQHLIQMMSSCPELNVIPVPWDIYLDSKLPKMIFKSLADTISVILGLQFRHIAPNAPAMRLWNNLLEEILTVISQFPELQAQGRPRRVYERLKGPTFRKTLLDYLACQQQNVSHWVSWVRYGGGVPIDYFNGYFVKRAKELGLSTPYNDMAIDAVKSRIAQRRLELEADIPHNNSPYMSDHDLISDGEPVAPLDMNLLKGMI